MNRILRHTVVGLASALALSSTHAFAQAVTGEFERTLSVAAPLELDVATGSGSISIRQGEVGQARVRGEIRVGRGWFTRSAADAEEMVRELEANPPIELSGSSLRVGHLEDDEFRQNVSISYEIVVPRDTTVRSRTGSGSQTVSGITASVDASTGSGSIELDDIVGAVDARTGSGSIRARGIAGAFEGSTGSGSVSLEQTGGGDVEVRTGSGNVDLGGIDGAVRARTGSGSIGLDGTPGGAWDLETGSGSVRVRMPADAAFALDARTSSGSVYTSHEITIAGAIERGTLRGDVNGGGPTVRMRTGSGSIRID